VIKQPFTGKQPAQIRCYPYLVRQSGSLMLLTLVVISLLANISLIGMDNAIHSNRLTTSFMSSSIALQRAQQAINLGETAIDQQVDFAVTSRFEPVSLGMFPQLHSFGSGYQSTWQQIIKNDLCFSNSHTVTQSLVKEPKNKPSSIKANKKVVSAYMIEQLLSESEAPARYYRVTACGLGLNGSTLAIVQTIVRYETRWQRVSWQQLR